MSAFLKAQTDQTEARFMEAVQEPPSHDFWIRLTDIMRETAEIDCLGASGNPKYNERTSAQFMLHSLLKLLASQSYFQKREKYLATLARLSTAAWGLNHGQGSPILTPAPKTSKNAGDLNTHAIIKGTAARAMSELMLGGTSREHAAREVAAALRQANKLGLRAGNRKPDITWRTVAGWRSELEEGPTDSESGARRLAYNGLIGDEFGTNPLARGKALIEELKTLSAKLI